MTLYMILFIYIENNLIYSYSSVDKWYGLGMHATNVEVYSDDFAFTAKWSSIFCSINPTRV